MKKLRFIVLILCFCLLSGCSSNSNNVCISHTLGISIPEDAEIEYNDTHGGFHGDGTTFAKLKFEDEAAEHIHTEIKKNDNWNELPLSENLQLIMYGGTKDSIEYNYNIAEEVGIPTIENGYWIFIDRYDDQNIINDDGQLFDRYSYNFTIAIYDADNDVLYYCEYDT